MDKLVVGGLIGAGGVVAGTIVSVVKDLWVERAKRKKEGEYLAIRLVCILDDFLEKCAAVVGDDGTCQGQLNKDGYAEAQEQTPELEFKSMKADWKSIPASLMYGILALPNQIKSANQSIDSTSLHVATPPEYEEYFTERQSQYSSLGVEASNLAQELRTKYNIPNRKYKNWNSVDYVRQHKIELLKKEITFEKTIRSYKKHDIEKG